MAARNRKVTIWPRGQGVWPGNTCSISNILTFLWRANGKPGAAEGVSDRDSAAKVQVLSGEKVVSLVPEVIFWSTAQATAPA